MSILTAIDTFAPTDLRRNSADLTMQEEDAHQQIDNITKDVSGKPQSPELDVLKTRLRDLVVKVNDLDSQRQQVRNKITDYLHEQLKSGTSRGKAYDKDKREEVEIPTAEWEY